MKAETAPTVIARSPAEAGRRGNPSGSSRIATAPARRGLATTIVALPSLLMRGLIRAYQLTVSPALPALFGPACLCRYQPTCSHYAAESFARHGFFGGFYLALRRLLRCTPWHRGGEDPVPASLTLRRTEPANAFACRRVSRPSLADG